MINNVLLTITADVFNLRSIMHLSFYIQVLYDTHDCDRFLTKNWKNLQLLSGQSHVSDFE